MLNLESSKRAAAVHRFTKIVGFSNATENTLQNIMTCTGKITAIHARDECRKPRTALEKTQATLVFRD